MFHSSNGIMSDNTITYGNTAMHDSVFLVLVIDTHYIRWDEISRYVTIDRLKLYLQKKYKFSPLCILEINEDRPVVLRGKYRKIVEYIGTKDGITIYVTSYRSKEFMKNILADKNDK